MWGARLKSLLLRACIVAMGDRIAGGEDDGRSAGVAVWE